MASQTNASSSSILDSNHKLLMQLFISRKVMTEPVYNDVHKRIFDNQGSPKDSILLMNNVIKENKINMKINEVICEVTNQLVYVLYPTFKSKYNSLSKFKSPGEKEYISLLFKEIAVSNTGRVSFAVAREMCRKMNNRQYTVSDSEETISKLVKQNILSDSFADETLSFTPVATIELESEFREAFSDNINDCYLCKSITFQGKKCQQCDAMFHIYCLNKIKHHCHDCGSIIDTNK